MSTQSKTVSTAKTTTPTSDPIYHVSEVVTGHACIPIRSYGNSEISVIIESADNYPLLLPRLYDYIETATRSHQGEPAVNELRKVLSKCDHDHPAAPPVRFWTTLLDNIHVALRDEVIIALELLVHAAPVQCDNDDPGRDLNTHLAEYIGITCKVAPERTHR